MDYTQSIAYLYEIASKKKLKHSLETVAGILSLFSSPQEELKIIHVAGTNGKGSTCAMLTQILMEAGFKVGTFTSPHLVKFNERLAVNNASIDDVKFASLASRVRNAQEKYFGIDGESLSFFEILTIMAFIYFKEARVDFAVIEAGMGGRLDSTNVITAPLLSVITEIGLDHMNILGSSLDLIAREKAGIIKKNCPAVLYLNKDEVYNVIKDFCVNLNSKLYNGASIRAEVSHTGLDGTVFSVKSDYYSYEDITLGLFGKYQVKNATGVLIAVRALGDCGIFISESAVKAALKKVKWPCRMEIMHKSPLILLDGAHNIDGAAAFDETMTFFSGKRIILVAGMLRDKLYPGIIELLSRRASVIIATSPESPRALGAAELAMEAAGMPKEIKVIENCFEAMDKAVSMARGEDVVCAAGSLYLAGVLRSYLRRKSHVGF